METSLTPILGQSKHIQCSHSLGKLIEWKRGILTNNDAFILSSPHSLGKLIERKYDLDFKGRKIILCPKIRTLLRNPKSPRLY